MLKMKKACQVPLAEKLFEEYEVRDNHIAANVGVDKIEDVLKHFIAMHDEPLFFILELPTNYNDETVSESGEVEVVEVYHKDVYYIDGCSQKEALSILNRVGELLYNDGLSAFGYGCHNSGDEIMFGEYNILTILSSNINAYSNFFEEHNISKTDSLITAWQTFSAETPGMCGSHSVNGETIYDIPKIFENYGMYFAERREE